MPLSVEDVSSKVDELVSSCPSETRESFSRDMEGFKALFKTFATRKETKIQWDAIKPPPPGTVLRYSKLDVCSEEDAPALLNQLAVLKLNGGLGTTMGCVGPKSVIEVRENQTFLDLTVEQIKTLNTKYSCNVPLILMNSFNTHEETKKIINKYSEDVAIKTFQQSRYPRIYKETFDLVPECANEGKDQWYPPGHGDVYFALYNSGILDSLLAEGKKYLFVSNVDNLGATVDLKILNELSKSSSEYFMEVVDKTIADVKGGTLIDYDGKSKLLEIAQVPTDKVDEFKSVKKFKIFNSNNIWLDIAAVKRLVEANAFDSMDIIVNPKVYNGKAILQLERAVGAGIEYFKEGRGINVTRARFLPVKSTSDLLIVQSNLYSVESGNMIMDRRRPFPTVPRVKLGSGFTKVADYQKRFKSIPDIIELDHLTVSGDITFGTGVTLRGTVIIVANHGDRIDIPSGAILENKVVSGNLRILDH